MTDDPHRTPGKPSDALLDRLDQIIELLKVIAEPVIRDNEHREFKGRMAALRWEMDQKKRDK